MTLYFINKFSYKLPLTGKSEACLYKTTKKVNKQLFRLNLRVNNCLSNLKNINK